MSSELNKLPEPFGYVSDWFGAPDGLMRFSRTPFPELHNLTHSVCSVFSVPQVLDVQQQACAAGKAERIASLEAERFSRDVDPTFAPLASNLAEKLAQVEAERDQLRAEVERLGADAERYRWLRDNLESEWAICEWQDDPDGLGYYRDARAPEFVDAAIDHARTTHKDPA